MKFTYKISFNVTPLLQRNLRTMGIDLDLGFHALRLPQSDRRWQEIAKLIPDWQKGLYIETEFSRAEYDAAHWLVLGPDWQYGYPQPEDRFFDITYDPTTICLGCRIDKVQVRPFRMKGEPKWGRRSILQMNWVDDEFFVKPEIYHSVFRPFQIPCLEVLHNRTGKALETVVQLKIDTVASHCISPTPAPLETCHVCGRMRYQIPGEGFFPKLPTYPDAPIFKTKEWFGGGDASHRDVIISQKLYRKIVSHSARGVTFRPVET